MRFGMGLGVASASAVPPQPGRPAPTKGVDAMNISKVYVALLVAAISLTTGCKTKSWTSDEFEGIWHLETGSRATSQTASTVATFKLEHDGRFIASSLPPDFLRLEDVKPNQVLSGSGTWSLRRDSEGEERLLLTFTNVEGGTGQDLPYGAELFIQGPSRDPGLFYFIGDPDENQRVVFRRDSSH